MPLRKGLTLEQYDHYGFLRVEVSKTQMIGTYLSNRYSTGAGLAGNVVESFAIDLTTKSVQTVP